MPHSILLVDDEANVSAAVQRSLRGEGYRFFSTTSGEDALKILEREDIDVVLTDERMPHMSGHEFLAIMRQRYPKKVALMLSGYSEFENVVNAINDGDISHFISKPWDKEDLKRTLERACALADERQQLSFEHQLASHAIEAYLQVGPGGEVRYANEAAAELMNPAAVLGTPDGDTHLQPFRSKHEASRWETLLHLAATTGAWQGPYAWPKGHKAYIPVDLSIHANRHGQDIVSFDLHIYANESSFLEAHDTRTILALDVDSGLLSRSEFMRRSTQMLGDQSDQIQTAVMVLRINEFTALFDSLGCQIAKQLVYALASRLKETMQKTGLSYELGRLSESDFAISLGIPTDHIDLERLCWEISHDFEQAVDIGEECIAVSINVGLSVSGDEEQSQVEELIHRALADIDKPTLRSDDCIGLTSELDQMLNCSLVFEKELDKAIQHGHLNVEFQPQVNLMNNETESFAALVHWNHPKYGDIPAAQFLPRAEETGLIHLLDDWLTYECSQTAAKAQHAGLQQRISIPLSALEFNSDQALKWIQQTIQRESNEFNMNLHSTLSIEISSSHLLNLNHDAIKRLQLFKDAGVEIILGDFCFDQEALDQLCELPLDGIKMGASLTKDIEHSWKRRAVIESVLRMVETLGLKVIACGIENEGQLDVLRSFPSTQILIQSFMVGAPLSADRVIKHYRHESH